MTIDYRPLRILLVEDNPGDIRLTQEALKESNIKSDLQVATDGEEALRLLRFPEWDSRLPDQATPYNQEQTPLKHLKPTTQSNLKPGDQGYSCQEQFFAAEGNARASHSAANYSNSDYSTFDKGLIPGSEPDKSEGVCINLHWPDLILLDLNLPKKHGCEVLKELKTDACLKYIPVIVLTTSQAPGDIFDAYALHANCYISKPVDIEQYFQVMKLIEAFWLKVVILPSRL